VAGGFAAERPIDSYRRQVPAQQQRRRSTALSSKCGIAGSVVLTAE